MCQQILVFLELEQCVVLLIIGFRHPEHRIGREIDFAFAFDHGLDLLSHL